jgi:hypothetical protein
MVNSAIDRASGTARSAGSRCLLRGYADEAFFGSLVVASTCSRNNCA